MKPRLTRLAVPALAAAITLAAAPAFAHAFLKSASPKVGSTVAVPPREVSITFSEAVEPSFSRITVTGPPGFGGAGPAQPKGDARTTLAAPLRAPLPPGDYVVRWRVLSVDSHITQGTFHRAEAVSWRSPRLAQVPTSARAVPKPPGFQSNLRLLALPGLGAPRSSSPAEAQVGNGRGRVVSSPQVARSPVTRTACWPS